MIRGTA